jgi:proteasome lid subunit RPN8/RPN11
MMLYVRDTSTEIAWHGTVKRNKEENWYLIKDVFLYPQTLTATTVNTDQEKYQEWLQNIEDDDVFNNIRFQGHSHVNMGTSPSGTDINMYNSFLQVLPKNDYYIFAIMNKTGSFTCFIYDLEKNLIYETQDINIKIVADKTCDLIKNINEEKDKYCSKFEYNTQYNTQAYLQTSSWPWEKSSCQTTYVDRLFDDLDSKYKNPSLIQPIKKNKKHHK